MSNPLTAVPIRAARWSALHPWRAILAWLAFVVVAAGVIVLRRKRPDLKRGFTVPWMPVIPILAIVSCVWLMLNLSALTWIRFVVWMAIGVLFYFLYSRG